MHVIGTAGHVDHGKSSLVRALTGTDPDRWLEEKLRGMTLDLGFARWCYEDVEAAVVDVPGHERFIHNMLAGAAGVELLLLVIAANEGPRPQTFEHLAILRYLNVRRVVVALSKCDTVAAGDRAQRCADVAADLAGTVAAGAPIVAVSTVTGEGLGDLRAALRNALAELPPRPIEAPAYLPIDRVFALGGYGTIVTGTLMQGRIAVGDRLVASGLGRDVRVRGVHVFGERRESVEAGARVALNLAGVERSELARGTVLASGQFAAAASFEVTFGVEPDARELMRRRMPVRAYIGAAELFGTLVFARLPNAGESTVPATLHLREPTIGVPGGVFVVRRMSPKTLLGGGTFADVRADVSTLPALGPELVDSPQVVALLAALERAGEAGATAVQLGALANIREERVRELASELVAHERAYALERPIAYASRRAVDRLIELVSVQLAAHERETPWRVGTTSLALARELGRPEADLVRVLAPAVAAGRIALRAGYYASADFTPYLAPDQRAFFDALFARDPNGAHVPVALAHVRARIRDSTITGVSGAFDTLLASGALHKVYEDVYRDDQIVALRGALVAALRERKSITPAEYRDLVGSSRKYVVPLLEWFDATGVTLRSGDTRVLRLAMQRQ